MLPTGLRALLRSELLIVLLFIVLFHILHCLVTDILYNKMLKGSHKTMNGGCKIDGNDPLSY